MIQVTKKFEGRKYFNTSIAQSLQFVDVYLSCAISVNVGASQMLLSRLDI